MLIKNIGLFINTLIIIDDYALITNLSKNRILYLFVLSDSCSIQVSTVFVTLPLCGRNETKKPLTTNFQTGYIRSTSRCLTLIMLSLGSQGDRYAAMHEECTN